MRINAYIAKNTGLSRRKVDELISKGKILVDETKATIGQDVNSDNKILVNGQPLNNNDSTTTILLNKPIGYVVSREGQGSKTIYDLIPDHLQKLKPIGRLDKNTSGLLLMTDDGKLANTLMHPSYKKIKKYKAVLDRPIEQTDVTKINNGIILEDGLSKLKISPASNDQKTLTIEMSEGKNRQIRRTFKAIGYEVKKLHRTQFGDYYLSNIDTGKWKYI